MSSFQNQLKNVKLKKAKEKTKDFSSPKMAGYLSDAEVNRYQSSVLTVNAERWLDVLSDVTFTSRFCPIFLEEAKLFIKVYENNYARMDTADIAATDWRGFLCNSENQLVTNMIARLDATIQTFRTDYENSQKVFVKTSSRSAKDAPLVKSRFLDLYLDHIHSYPVDERKEENVRITSLLKAAFDAMAIDSASEVMDMFFRSERIYQDMLLAVKQFEGRDGESEFHEHFVVREFVHIDVDMEFRGFVYRHHMTALSQYNYLIYSPRLVSQKDAVRDLILTFFEGRVKDRMKESGVADSYIIDFAVVTNASEQEVKVIELNPFENTTNGALFSWEHERGSVLETEEGFEFRVVTKPKPGSTAMLPKSVRDLLRSAE